MYYFITSLLLLGATVSNAHHILTNLHVDGVDQGDGVCVRVAPNTNPITDVTSPIMACNINGEETLNKICPVDAGSRISLEFRTWADGSQNSPIDVSHQGPCAAYMKKVDSFADSAAGDGWFKIYHYGFQNGKFCTDVLRENGGMLDVTIPEDLAGGLYLMRGESLALHQGQNYGGAQWYIGCVQIAVSSTGGSATPPTVSIPGYVKATDPGVLFDYWSNQHPTNYIVPGPAPYVPTNAGGGEAIATKYSSKYPVCMASNADWCGVPVPSFTDEASCYSAVSNCWNQLDECYGTAPVTGHSGCDTFEATCTSYQAHCAECGAARNCAGSFPAYHKQRVRDEHRGPLAKRTAVETSYNHGSHRGSLQKRRGHRAL